MFTPGHLHRDNNDRPEHMRLLPPFSVDFYYEVRKDPEQGPMLHMRLVGEVDGKHFEEEFELHRDVAFNFASVATRIAARHGLHPNASPVMRGHDEYDKVFADIRAKLNAQPGEPVNLDHIL
ncbi:DUF5064 family protein [Ectopseudomonas toyotomiensis]|uniref:DUF5064 family protein n=1 Tax=Ectopseudomonas toyotomiensis TaxID=554344 RepID=A0ABD7DWC6_9GAMM|nr:MULTISPECIES: DUF5064 family protein [Pseudomonas]QSL91310.1 DUF5064 family protein [Pseudomonas toyotomiensis]SDA53615.1 protein of unknown function [Pseudomonas sp. NFPP33]